MDYGGALSCSFSTYVEDVSGDVTAAASRSEAQRLHQYVLNTNVKLLTVADLQRVLKGRLADTELLSETAEASLECPGASRLLSLQLVHLRTVMHLLYRYQLLLIRDLMRAESRLGRPPSPEVWRDWYANEAALRSHAPNVHDAFLWTFNLPHPEDGDRSLASDGAFEGPPAPAGGGGGLEEGDSLDFGDMYSSGSMSDDSHPFTGLAPALWRLQE